MASLAKICTVSVFHAAEDGGLPTRPRGDGGCTHVVAAARPTRKHTSEGSIMDRIKAQQPMNKGGLTPLRHAIKVQTQSDKAPFSGLKLLLIAESGPLKANSITFSKQDCFHTLPPSHTHPRPLLSGSPEAR